MKHNGYCKLIGYMERIAEKCCVTVLNLEVTQFSTRIPRYNRSGRLRMRGYNTFDWLEEYVRDSVSYDLEDLDILDEIKNDTFFEYNFFIRVEDTSRMTELSLCGIEYDTENHYESDGKPEPFEFKDLLGGYYFSLADLEDFMERSRGFEEGKPESYTMAKELNITEDEYLKLKKEQGGGRMKAFTDSIITKEELLKKVVKYKIDNPSDENQFCVRQLVMFGVPEWLVYLQEGISEMFLESDKPFLEFINAINSGSDLNDVRPQFILHLLNSILSTIPEKGFDDERKAVLTCLNLWQRSDLYSTDWYECLSTLNSDAEECAFDAPEFSLEESLWDLVFHASRSGLTGSVSDAATSYVEALRAVFFDRFFCEQEEEVFNKNLYNAERDTNRELQEKLLELIKGCK